MPFCTLEEILTLCSQNSVCTDPNSDSVQTRFRPNRVCTESNFSWKTVSSRITYILSESVQTLYFRKYRESVFSTKTDSGRACTGSVQALFAFFENFVPTQYRHCTVPFSDTVPRGYRLPESKKCQYRATGNVHCRYIACFRRY